MKGKVQHNFQESLEQSHRFSELPFWYDLYEQFFPNMVSMQSYQEYGYWQQQGVDRGIILNTSKQVLIDEKVRYRNAITGKVYDDIALEYWSNYERKIPGWVCKPLMADYICYVIAPLGLVYLLPVLQLQQAWGRYSEQWKAENYVISAQNSGYTSKSVAIRPEVLFRAIGGCLKEKLLSI